MSPESNPINILHVDDDPGLAEMVAQFIEREAQDFQVETALSASSGLDRISENGFDCIVSDYDMPELNGIELLNEIREMKGDLPFILYTGKGSEEIASEAISAGVSDYLQKESGTAQYTVLAHRIRSSVERYRSRRSIEDLESKLTQLAERTDDILYMFNEDWNELLFINSAFEDIWGVSVDQLGDDPQSFMNRIHEEDREKARRSMERLANGQPDEIEYRVVQPDGEIHWVRGQSKPTFDDAGDVEQIVGFVRDITEHKRSEDSLQTIEKANEGVSFVEEDGRFSFVNETFAAVFGYEPDELIGNHWSVLYEDEEAERLAEDILPAVYDIGYWSGETVRQTKTGDRLITDHRLALTSENVILCTARDITKERIEAGELCHGDKILVEALDEAAFYTLDHEGCITRWNERATEMIGYSAEEILGKHISEFYTTSDREAGKPEEMLAQARNDGTLTEHGWRLRSDGTRFRTNVTISARFNEAGILEGYGKLHQPTSETES